MWQRIGVRGGPDGEAGRLEGQSRDYSFVLFGEKAREVEGHN